MMTEGMQQYFETSAPSKTFLLGEYVVLNEGPSVILTTSPRFTLIAKLTADKKNQRSLIHPDSPAGKLLQHNPTILKNYQLTFIDPYHGIGGFGASSAQFLMVAALKHYLEDQPLNEMTMLNEYQTLSWDGQGVRPSGVDLIAQLHGGLCCFHKKINELKIYSWPFNDIDYCLIHTGNKLATHHHLKKISPFDTSELEHIVYKGMQSLQHANSQQFVDAISTYADLLKSKKLVADSTETLVKEIANEKDILAVKGCGALGADVIAAFFKRDNQRILPRLKSKKLNIVSHGHQVENGLTISTRP